MDGRRKNIRDLEQQREKDLESLNLMLKTLGEALLIRREAGEPSGFSAETGEYRRLVREIAASEDAVKAARAEAERFKELEDKDGSGVFSWIGKGARGLVLRSFLGNRPGPGNDKNL
jgi:hypothetical protein